MLKKEYRFEMCDIGKLIQLTIFWILSSILILTFFCPQVKNSTLLDSISTAGQDTGIVSTDWPEQKENYQSILESYLKLCLCTVIISVHITVCCKSTSISILTHTAAMLESTYAMELSVYWLACFFLICIVGGGIKVHTTLRPLNGILCQPRVIMMIMAKSVEWLTGETEVLKENLSQYRFVHHKPHMLPVREPGPPR
jgi:hypothetical protein